MKDPAGTVLWGNVIHQEGWKVGSAAYGMYSVGTTAPIQVNALGLMNYMEVNSGSGIVGDVFHAMYLDLFGILGRSSHSAPLYLRYRHLGTTV